MYFVCNEILWILTNIKSYKDLCEHMKKSDFFWRMYDQTAQYNGKEYKFGYDKEYNDEMNDEIHNKFVQFYFDFLFKRTKLTSQEKLALKQFDGTCPKIMRYY
jgi:hypothetical protein